MQIVADLHTHTSVSHHAFSTLDEMIKQASELGHVAIGITNHGPSMPDGAHKWHFGNYGSLPSRRIHGVRLLPGIELNIHPDGSIDDVPIEYLNSLDLVIASFHEQVFPSADIDTHTNALLGMMNNPLVTIFGHLGNPAFAFHKEEVISACKKYGKAVEINAGSLKSRRGSHENCLEIAKLCKDYQVPVFLNTDSHSIYTIGKVDSVAEIAMQAGLTKKDIVNANIDSLRAFFLEKRGIDILG